MRSMRSEPGFMRIVWTMIWARNYGVDRGGKNWYGTKVWPGHFTKIIVPKLMFLSNMIDQAMSTLHEKIMPFKNMKINFTIKFLKILKMVNYNYIIIF